MDKNIPLLLGISGLLIIALLFAGYYKVELAKKNNVIARVDADKSCRKVFRRDPDNYGFLYFFIYPSD